MIYGTLCLFRRGVMRNRTLGRRSSRNRAACRRRCRWLLICRSGLAHGQFERKYHRDAEISMLVSHLTMPSQQAQTSFGAHVTRVSSKSTILHPQRHAGNCGHEEHSAPLVLVFTDGAAPNDGRHNARAG